MFPRRTLLQSVLFTLCLAPLAALAAPGIELEKGLTLLPPIVVEPLAVFPVVQAKQETPKGDFLSLTQGLKEKLVVVTEIEKGASVNNVQVANKSDKPLLLLGGEIILGGQQDRVISGDTIIEPRQSQKVAVFCVEHGRWSGAGQFNRTGGLAEGKLRRLAKYNQNQGEVWQQVAAKTAALKATSETGTYRTLAAGEEGKKASERFAKIKSALAALPEAAQVVGLVSAVNGTVRSVDIFGTPELFASYRDGLLDSMFIDAADATGEKKPAPAPAAVKDFFDDAQKADGKETSKSSLGNTVQKKGKGVSGSEVNTKALPKPAYRSYQSESY